MSWNDELPKYSTYKNKLFKKYCDKARTIRNNINFSSLKDSDKKKLFELIKKELDFR
jgi:trans-2-enoyl-CoA reductase